LKKKSFTIIITKTFLIVLILIDCRIERNADFHDEQFKKKLVRVADTGVEKMKTDVSMYPVSPERNISQTNSKGKPAVSWFE